MLVITSKTWISQVLTNGIFSLDYFITPHAQRERGKVIDRGVHIYIYSASSLERPITFLDIKPFLLGVKTSGYKRKLCYIESTIVPSYNSIMGAVFEYDINQA